MLIFIIFFSKNPTIISFYFSIFAIEKNKKSKEMKKSIAIILLLFSQASVSYAAEMGHRIEPVLSADSISRNYYLNFYSIVDRKDTFPIKRTPAAYSLLPKAWIEEMSLMLQGVVTIEHLYYEIAQTTDCLNTECYNITKESTATTTQKPSGGKVFPCGLL